jgi:glycosyl transferase family 25
VAAPAPSAGARAAYQFLNGWADRVYVVTLARAIERHAHATEALRGLDFRFHPGVDKATLDLSALEREGRLAPWRGRRRLTGKPRPLSPGEVGCAMSHRQLYEEIVRSGLRRAVVLEDDVAPREEDVALLPEALRELPDDWDLVYLGYTHFERVRPWERAKRLAYLALAPLRLVPWTPGEALRLHPRPYSTRLRRAGYHDGTYAYAVSGTGAAKLLEAQTPIVHPADHAFVRLVLGGRLNAFVTEPKAFDEVSATIAGPRYAEGARARDHR